VGIVEAFEGFGGVVFDVVMDKDEEEINQRRDGIYLDLGAIFRKTWLKRMLAKRR
jgi:hypothetical protein